MLRKQTALGLIAALTLGSAAAADDHVIMIMGDGYFPTISYVEEGDTLVFVNGISSAVEVIGGEDAWTTGVIDADSEVTVEVVAGMATGFTLADDQSVAGALSFQSAPVN